MVEAIMAAIMVVAVGALDTEAIMVVGAADSAVVACAADSAAAHVVRLAVEDAADSVVEDAEVAAAEEGAKSSDYVKTNILIE